MRDLIRISGSEMGRIQTHFLLPHGMPRVNDGRVLSEIAFLHQNPNLGPVHVTIDRCFFFIAP